MEPQRPAGSRLSIGKSNYHSSTMASNTEAVTSNPKMSSWTKRSRKYTPIIQSQHLAILGLLSKHRNKTPITRSSGKQV